MPDENVFFYGVSTPVKYQVKVDLNGGSIDSIPDGWSYDEGLYIKDWNYGTPAEEIEYDFRNVVKTECHNSWNSTHPAVTVYGLEITAEWEINKYTIHWINDDGTEIRET